MKELDSLRNPNRWCDFHNDHGHKIEDCVALKMEVSELLKKGQLREFLSDRDRNLLNKEITSQPTVAVLASPPQQDRIINNIYGGSEVSSVSHAAAKKRTRNAKNGTNKISFMANMQEKVLTPHHDALVISLTVANCQVKRILVNNRNSTNIIFQTVYHDLGLEEDALT
ncbi:hypothetical protein N665_0015s0092 [Sinapis alba]|nr:hypothetical protein N665_0015s0092 [Sinapis alba]